MDEGKKLVRGLKDVSPLFRVEAEEAPVKRALELQVVGVTSPQNDGDSLFLNTFFASQIASSDKPCSLVSILSRHSRHAQIVAPQSSESFGNHLRRYCMFWDELNGVVNPDSGTQEKRLLKSRDIFLDFESRQLLYSEQIVKILDKWVLLMRPTAESLTEGYKLIKAGLAINPQMEFFITLEGKADEMKGGMVAERFSDFVTKHLSIDLGWLGWVDLSDPDRHFSSTLHTDQLLFQSWDHRPNLEKFALAGWIESMEQKEQTICLEEVLQ